ncbi:DNA replication/repair protein RecF [Candidatus Poriferisodalis sp.]|uniref:DNA replication/repair protein RecF n=1 Tax=Candidatus Poriferisodalis sp. TaxID=3101277 RepID=UPI003B01393E
MILAWLSIEDFRNHRSTVVSFDRGRTLVVGPNGHGKTNLLEAVAMLTGAGSFRGANAETLVRAGSQRAYTRAEVRRRGRPSLVEMEIAVGGRSRAQVNGRRVRTLRDLADIVTAVVFCPGDLTITAGGPSMRRALADEVLASTDREFRAVRADLERILRQRNNLLKQVGRRPDGDALNTLDVWDDQFAATGEIVARQRAALAGALAPAAQETYRRLAGTDARLELSYVTSWAGDSLAAALECSRSGDLRRGTTSVGPHRDELEIALDGLPARTHSSQGEQRSIALSLRLAQHRYVADCLGTAPIVLLDDMFSELDEDRARRLVDCLPDAQTVLTSATGHVPDGIDFGSRVEIRDGTAVSGAVRDGAGADGRA